MKVLDEHIIKFLQEEYDNVIKTLEELCKIPAPSGYEDRRAQYVYNYLKELGAEGVYIDDAKNVVFPYMTDGKNDLTVFTAHTDTVFPDLEYPMPFRIENNIAYSPSVGDDTICLVLMLTVIKYILKNKLKTHSGVVFVANSCEEGLGNLKGVKEIMKTFKGRVKQLYTFDGTYNFIVDKCVGSHRYKVEFTTEGGHSFNDFGNRNAIVAMANMICELNKCKVPKINDSKTTFNVGVVEGGTSVNTIAQKCSMLYEYRSDDKDCLAYMQNFFNQVVEGERAKNLAQITVSLLGERPCGALNNFDLLNKMVERVKEITIAHTGSVCINNSGSTDCNIPMSLGIPAVCVGNHIGGGMHTRQEWVDLTSIPAGLKITANLILDYFE